MQKSAKHEQESNEERLYQSALAVERDESLNEEMADWDVTLEDGFPLSRE